MRKNSRKQNYINPEPDVALVKESHCLRCNARLNALGTGNRLVEAKPEPGDITVCIQCGAVMKLDFQLQPRGFTESEMWELIHDRAWMNYVASLVKTVHFMKHEIG